MDHLTPSSREADSGLIVEEELVNISQPSSPQSIPRAGISVPLSNSCELNRASGALDNIPRDEDGESIMTIDEDYDAHSETGSITSLRTPKSSFPQTSPASRESLVSVRSETSSISSLGTRESSFDRMASASRESLDSVRSMLFAPSFGTLNMNIRELVKYLQSKHRLRSEEHTSELQSHSDLVCRLLL